MSDVGDGRSYQVARGCNGNWSMDETYHSSLSVQSNKKALYSPVCESRCLRHSDYEILRAAGVAVRQ